MNTRRRTLILAAVVGLGAVPAYGEKMQIGFLWHMHQPIYFPGENINQTQAANRYSFSLYDVHNQRYGPYTTWPGNAIQTGIHLPNLGASVSFSGSLIENLNHMRNAGVNGGMWNNWNAPYTQARQWNTVEANPRLDLIGFTYHHALMPLLDERDLRMQIQMHKVATQQTFGSNVPFAKGFFPAETAFSTRIIPALVAEGFEWTIVDNIHFDRATKGYPHTNNSGMFAPNKADQINPDPTTTGGAWIQLNNLWAPSKVSAPFSYLPHHVQHVNPNTGEISKIIAVPGARYEGNEDGRGGFGALQYQQVMDQYKQYNTDPNRPLLVVLHHDGDNFGGGSHSYYHHNFENMVNWATGNPDYNVTTISDYLKRFPVPTSDVVHIANGSWAGADAGDPEFKKWLGDPNPSGWSPDRNSWAVLTAAKNRVYTAEDIVGPASVSNVISGSGNAAERAWHYLVQAQSSDHWYWDGTEIWDSNVTRGSNLAVQQADLVLNSFAGTEQTPPTVFIPQRTSYNPGAFQWGSTPEPSDFSVWTFAYDVSGLTSVTLKWRIDLDGENPLDSIQNETYAGGDEVGPWQSIPMTGANMPNQPSNILAPNYRAQQYSAMITGQSNVLIDYYVEAVDAHGNITRSDIQHVWVGGSTTPPPPAGGQFAMDGVLDPDAKLIASKNGMNLWYSMHGGKLYVATNDAGEGSDHFIYIASPPGPMVPANWAKSGQIAQWSAYLADENDNDFSAWFDAVGANAAATGPNGGVLEGWIDLAGQFGSIPDEIWLAVGLYATQDGGALLYTHQLPGTLDNDGNIQANEYLRLVLPKGWALGSGGDWNTTWNWADAIPNDAGAHARLLNVIATPSTVTTDTPVTVGHITFDSPYGYTVGGAGSLNLNVASGSASINVAAGLHQLALPVTLSDDTVATVSSAGMLRFNESLNIANGSTLTTAGEGTVQINGPVIASAGAKVRVAAGLLSVNSDLNGASLQVDAGDVLLGRDQRLGSLSVGDGAGVWMAPRASQLPGSMPVLRVQSLSVAGDGLLDLADNDLIVDYTGDSPFDALQALVLAGYRAAPDPTATGIISSTSQNQGGDTILVLLDNVMLGGAITQWMGFAIDETTIIGKYTYFGDANLDGQVTGDDFALAVSSLGMTSAHWIHGDVNFSGTVTGDDIAIIVSNLGKGAGNPLGTAIPEPGMLGLIGLAAAIMPRRRACRGDTCVACGRGLSV